MSGLCGDCSGDVEDVGEEDAESASADGDVDVDINDQDWKFYDGFFFMNFNLINFLSLCLII